jgi:hypothetical protein
MIKSNEPTFFQVKGDLVLFEARKISTVTEGGIKKSDEQIQAESRASAKVPYKILAVGKDVDRCKAGDYVFFDGNAMGNSPQDNGYFVVNVAEKEYLVTHNHAVAIVITDMHEFNQEAVANKALADDARKKEQDLLRETKGKLRTIN